MATRADAASAHLRVPARAFGAWAVGLGAAAYALGYAALYPAVGAVAGVVALVPALAVAAVTACRERLAARTHEHARLLQREVVQREAAEARHRRAAEYALSLVEASVDAVFVVDEAGIVRDVNAAAEAFTGTQRADLKGVTFAATLAGPEAAHRALAEAWSTGRSEGTRGRFVAPTGATRDVLLNVGRMAAPMVAGQALVVTARDISKRLALEEQALRQRDALARTEHLAALGSLVAGVAHEINNPLTYLRGNIELAVMDHDEHARAHPGCDAVVDRAGLQQALAGADHVARVTAALKAVAQPGEGEHAPVDVAAVAQDVTRLIAVSPARGRDVDVQFTRPRTASA